MALPRKLNSGMDFRRGVVDAVNGIIDHLARMRIVGDNRTTTVQETAAGTVVHAIQPQAYRAAAWRNRGNIDFDVKVISDSPLKIRVVFLTESLFFYWFDSGVLKLTKGTISDLENSGSGGWITYWKDFNVTAPNKYYITLTVDTDGRLHLGTALSLPDDGGSTVAIGEVRVDLYNIARGGNSFSYRILEPGIPLFLATASSSSGSSTPPDPSSSSSSSDPWGSPDSVDAVIDYRSTTTRDGEMLAGKQFTARLTGNSGYSWQGEVQITDLVTGNVSTVTLALNGGGVYWQLGQNPDYLAQFSLPVNTRVVGGVTYYELPPEVHYDNAPEPMRVVTDITFAFVPRGA